MGLGAVFSGGPALMPFFLPVYTLDPLGLHLPLCCNWKLSSHSMYLVGKDPCCWHNKAVMKYGKPIPRGRSLDPRDILMA
ncbi:uncharacterized protein G2W53_010487 [Senna tora]|uniref:Uncharacterized protein n=1 Tax=Senna tora TaxID=362788 RepID=A0A834WZW1_9FABA|nr:uncharacterized protein G2W53_010487 [Senna tora]